MPFTINQDTLLINGRKGDTASFSFNFGKDISMYTVNFFIKKNMYDKVPIVSVSVAGSVSGTATVNLTSTNTDKLIISKNEDFGSYYWGLRLEDAATNGVDFSQTLIPKDISNPPELYVYPEIGD